MALLTVLRLTALPQLPDAKTEADAGRRVAGHGEQVARRADAFGGHRVELRAEAARGSRRLGEGMADGGEGEGHPTGKRRQDLPPQIEATDDRRALDDGTGHLRFS